LYELYQKVVNRGGSIKVTARKMWKDIVNEFNLPNSCTSASHTLKNHYEKYLLAYEQLFFFNKNEEELIKDLG
jgi:ARID/BRIGHT DNA binding domain